MEPIEIERPTLAEEVIKKMGKSILDPIAKIKPPTCHQNTITGWVGFRSVVHAMIRTAEGHTPLCNNRRERESTSRYDPLIDVKSHIADAAKPTAKSSILVRLALCELCKNQLPASCTVQARAEGLLYLTFHP